MTDSDKLEIAAREKYFELNIGEDNDSEDTFRHNEITFIERLAFKAGSLWREQNPEEILHAFTGAIQHAVATGKMPRATSSNDWANFVIEYVNELNKNNQKS